MSSSRAVGTCDMPSNTHSLSFWTLESLFGLGPCFSAKEVPGLVLARPLVRR